MTGKHEQLIIEGFNCSSEHDKRSKPRDLPRIEVSESRVMLTATARQRLDMIIKGDIKDSKDIEAHLDTLQNK